MVSLKQAPRASTRQLLPLDEYDRIIVSFSGGKDSLAMVLHLLELGVPAGKIQLWHQCVDGNPLDDPDFADWPCTYSYVEAVAAQLDVEVFYQWREGGFYAELVKENARTREVRFDMQDGESVGRAGGVKSKIGTRKMFPQKTGDLAVRWCSAVLKIDVFALAFNNDPGLRGGPYLVCTGERREESAGRALYRASEPHRCDSNGRRVDAWRPVIDWPEMGVWKIIQRHGMRAHPAYYLGFPRVSCATCIFGNGDQWASLRQVWPEAFERIAELEDRFGVTITQGKTVRQMADAGQVYPQCHNKGLVAEAVQKIYPWSARVCPWELPAGAFKKGGGPT
jgi:3'-phosphoadenosine 5'-phosphosulfate sulfotransferase (PAPS reductase)/FAD synthetase